MSENVTKIKVTLQAMRRIKMELSEDEQKSGEKQARIYALEDLINALQSELDELREPELYSIRCRNDEIIFSIDHQHFRLAYEHDPGEPERQQFYVNQLSMAFDRLIKKASARAN